MTSKAALKRAASEELNESTERSKNAKKIKKPWCHREADSGYRRS
jgi:hypothetical protein